MHVQALHGFQVGVVERHARFFVRAGFGPHCLHRFKLLAQAFGFSLELGLNHIGISLALFVHGIGIGSLDIDRCHADLLVANCLSFHL